MLKPRTAFLVLLLIAALIVCIIVFTTDIEEALADGQPAPTPSPMVWVIEVVPTPSPTPIASPVPTPTPIDTRAGLPALPKYDYPSEDLRCISRGIWSVCPKYPSKETKEAFAWLVLNRVDDNTGDFEDSPRWVLLQGNEFMDYDPDAHMSKENNEIADYVLRAWAHEKATGDAAYRLVRADGLYCSFYRIHDVDYITIYNRAGDVVYDSGKQV